MGSPTFKISEIFHLEKHVPTISALRRAVLVSLYGTAALAAMAPAAHAQSADANASAAPIQSVNVVGSRRATSSSTDTVVPVDVIPMNKVAEQGAQFDLSQTLTYISPSFNSTRQTGADGADLVDSAALRGLSSDQTLVPVSYTHLTLPTKA